MDPSGEQRESLIESIRVTRQRSPLAGFGDRSGPWTVPISLALLAIGLLVTFGYLRDWHYLGSALLFAVGAGCSHFAMRKGHPLALPTGIAALLACGAAVALFVVAPH